MDGGVPVLEPEQSASATRGRGRTDVLICGAGPTGLVLALRLARSGIRFRIVDAAAEPGTTSRALVVHARTLELYRQMGVAEAFLHEAMKFVAVNLWVRGSHVARVPLGDIGRRLSPFPFMTVCSQDRHERFLIAQLRRAGVEVERPVELLDFEQADGGVRVRLQGPSGTETCDAAYLAGCDGAHSRVREVLGAGFPGGTYSRVFYVADVEAAGPVMNDELHVALDEADLLGVFPLQGGRTARLIGTVRTEHESAREALVWDDVRGKAAERLGIVVDKINWFSTYRVHHRVARRFQQGRVFLLGDAAHIHSPVGGQGMNTGIGDAIDLGWKLADVVGGRGRPEVLDSYEPERIAFARRLVATTDRGFTIATSTGRFARFVRMSLLPIALPIVVRFRFVQRVMFRLVSQIAIHYRGSPLSTGALGRIHAGDRLPWVELGEGADPPDNHGLLNGLDWQVHVYGAPRPGLAESCRMLDLPLHVLPWTARAREAGFTESAPYLVRPDGYIGLVQAPDAPLDLIASYMETVVGRKPRR